MEVVVAKDTHRALYSFMTLMPITGVAHSYYGGRGVPVVGSEEVVLVAPEQSVDAQLADKVGSSSSSSSSISSSSSGGGSGSSSSSRGSSSSSSSSSSGSSGSYFPLGIDQDEG